VTEKDEVGPLPGEDRLDKPAVLAMDGIRIATLIMLGVHTVAVVVLSVFLVTNVQTQRQVNECYQLQIDALTTWAATAVQAGRSDRQAQRELLLTQEIGVDRQGAIERYLTRLDQADEARATAPVPAQRCAR
jgi:hypothetical protein